MTSVLEFNGQLVSLQTTLKKLLGGDIIVEEKKNMIWIKIITMCLFQRAPPGLLLGLEHIIMIIHHGLFDYYFLSLA